MEAKHNSRFVWVKALGYWALNLSMFLTPIVAMANHATPVAAARESIADGTMATVPWILKVPNTDPKDYYFQLLQAAMAAAAHGRIMPVFEQAVPMAQGRATYELLKGNLVDIYWMGTDDIREKNLRYIPIPLDRGLLGFRRFIIHKDMVETFDKVKDFKDLQKLLACQGRDWPDAKIMRRAGLRVTEANQVENLYQQVVARRCDYFPRGYLEAELEMNANAKTYPELTYYHELLLYYPFTSYFFVNPKNTALEQWIRDGLEAMIESGEFVRFMKEHPYTTEVFSTSELQRVTRLIRIDNPMMSRNTHYKDARYWLQPEDFIRQPLQ